MSDHLYCATPDGSTPPLIYAEPRKSAEVDISARPDAASAPKPTGVPLQYPHPVPPRVLPHAAVDIALSVTARPTAAPVDDSTGTDDTDPVRASHPLTELAAHYLNALLQADRATAESLILDALAAGTNIRDIYLHIFQLSQYEVGRLWENGAITVAQEHFCTAATQMIMAQLYPQIFSGERNGLRMVAACADHEHHEIGIRMVADFFEMEGWDTHYLGADVDAQTLVDAVAEQQAHLVALSATMPPSITALSELIDALRADTRTRPIKILVGGFGFNGQVHAWQTAGADGYAANAQEAVTTAQTLLHAPPRASGSITLTSTGRAQSAPDFDHSGSLQLPEWYCSRQLRNFD